MKKVFILFAAVMLCGLMVACGNNSNGNSNGKDDTKANVSTENTTKPQIAGEWLLVRQCKGGECHDEGGFRWEINEDGTFFETEGTTYSGTWELNDNALKMKYDKNGDVLQYKVEKLDGKKMTLLSENEKSLYFEKQ